MGNLSTTQSPGQVDNSSSTNSKKEDALSSSFTSQKEVSRDQFSSKPAVHHKALGPQEQSKFQQHKNNNPFLSQQESKEGS